MHSSFNIYMCLCLIFFFFLILEGIGFKKKQKVLSETWFKDT